MFNSTVAFARHFGDPKVTVGRTLAPEFEARMLQVRASHAYMQVAVYKLALKPKNEYRSNKNRCVHSGKNVKRLRQIVWLQSLPS